MFAFFDIGQTSSNKMKTLRIISFYVLMAVSSATLCGKGNQNSNKPITQQQAVEAAENFVNEGGHSSELDGLHPTAYFISEDSNRWNIGFVSKELDTIRLSNHQESIDWPGRAVIVDKESGGIWLAHKEPLFSRWRKL